jgi:predicted phosphohydrolase
MTQLVWATDVHLDFLAEADRDRFAAAIAVAARGARGVVLTGDIAQGVDVDARLAELAVAVQAPIWFVLGNHDYYRSSIAAVRARMRAVTAGHPTLAWLPAAGVVRLSDDVALIGHDGWGDARLGDPDRTTVMLNDFVLIDELAGLDRGARHARLRALGDEAAASLDAHLAEALGWARWVVVAIHVPPFREACWHDGAISDDAWLPYFTCAAAGDVLRAAMAARPDVQMTVLCGHTHGAGEAAILPNLRVVTGGADYGTPVVRRWSRPPC